MAAAGTVKRNVLASWGTHAAGVVITFFLTRYTLDVLSTSTYGSWLLINSIAGYAGLLYCGMGETVNRFVAKYHSEGNLTRVNQLINVILAAYLTMGGVAFLCACVLCATCSWWGDWTGESLWDVRITILMLGVNVVVGMAGSVFGGVLYGLRRFDLERAVAMTFILVRAALFLLLLREQHGLIIIAGIYFVVTLGENLSYIVLARLILPSLSIGPSHFDRGVFRECSGFSSMSFLNTVANQLSNSTDTITIGLMLGKEAIIPYYFGLRLAQFVKDPIDKIARICMPTTGALQSATDRSKRERFLMKSLGIVFLLVGGAFIGGWFFGKDVIRLWIGSKLTPDNLAMSHRILVILLAAQLIALPCGILRAFLFGSGVVRAPALIYLAEAVCNLTLSIVLCITHGIEGVAWGTTISVALVELGVLVPFALRQLNVSGWRILREAFQPQALPLLALLAFSLTVSNQSWSHEDWRALIGIAISGTAILGATIWLRARLNDAELATARAN
jgi:O-antigen/teichoic acid export membrane protein